MGMQDVADSIERYWGNVFRAREYDAEASEEFLQYAQDPGLDSGWVWPVGRTREVAEGVRDSTPGADGLPYSFWQSAPGIFHDTLDALMIRATHGESFPSTVSTTTTTPIPKAEVGADADEVRWSAATVRPITLMRVSAKLGALVLNGELAQVAARSVAYPQRGFVAGRVIDDDVIGFDGAMTAASLRPNGHAAGILFDFEAAFPSLGHGWIFALLSKMALPPRMLVLIKVMYRDLHTDFVIGGHHCVRVFPRSGIRKDAH